MNFYDKKTLENIQNTHNQKFKEIVKHTDTNKFQLKNLSISKDLLVNNLKLLKKITNKNYIENFKKVNNLTDENVLSEILTTILKNIVNVDKPEDFNSMEVKSFITSFFYNIKLLLKNGKNKQEYLDLIKNYSVDFLTNYLSDLKINLVNDLVYDIEFLIQNKKITKFVKLSVKIASLFL